MSYYVVNDIALADFGRKELDIAETEMPGLISLPKTKVSVSTQCYGYHVCAEKL